MKLSRRDFLSLVAAAGSTACIGGSDAKERSLQLLGAWPEGEESWTPTICRECPAGCGLLGRVVDGRVVGLVGNPLHPVNRGAICARGSGALQTVYDSKRFAGPMIRREGKLVGATWDEALARVGEQLRVVRERGQPERLSIVVGELPQIRDELWTRFALAYGTPNLTRIRTHDRARASVAERIVYGAERPVAYDWERSDLVLSFGVPLLDGGTSPVRQHRQRNELRKRGGKLIQVESRLSATAARADDWVAIVPGSEAAIALSLARIVIERGRHDSSVEALPGYGPWVDAAGERQPGFGAWLRSHYDSAWCEETTGVSAARIEALGEQLVNAQSPVALFESGQSRHEQGLYSQLAFAALNLLIGAPGRKGGLHSQPPPPIGPSAESKGASHFDALAKAGSARPRIDGVEGDSAILERDEPLEWAERVALRDGSAMDIVIIDGVDPLRELAKGSVLAGELDRLPMVVVLASAPNAATDHADIVLPSTHFLESWGEDIPLEEPGLSVYSVAQPVVSPSTDARPAEEIVSALGDAVGPPVSGLLSAPLKETIRRRAGGLHRSGRGQVGMELADRQIRRVSRERASSGPLPRSERRFMKGLFDVGVWVDREPNSPDPLPSSFGGPVLDRELPRAGDLRDRLSKGMREPEAIFLPHYEGPVLGAETAVIAPGVKLPIVFFETAGLGQAGSRAPWLREALSPSSPRSWSLWAEINPRTADLLKIWHMQRVRVVTSRGEILVLASLTETARPGFIYLPLGVDTEVEAVGGIDARFLIEPTRDPFAGVGIINGTSALIAPA